MDEPRFVEVEASTKDEAITKALKNLKVSKDEVKIEVLSEKKPFLGMGGSCKIKATLLLKQESTENADSKNEVQDKDGSYEITAKEDGIYLTVNPPEGEGKKVRLENITSRLKFCEIKDFEFKKITEAIKEPSGLQTWIAPAQEMVSKDCEATVEISKDQLEAFVMLMEPWGNGKPLSKDDLDALLKKEGIVYGTNQEVIEKISLAPKEFGSGKPVLIARGKSPVNGENAGIEYLFEKGEEEKPLFENSENQNIDFREFNLIVNVSKGQELAKKIPPTAGEPGINVKGEEIPQKPGKDIKLPFGKNVGSKETDKGTFVIAEIDGRPQIKGGKIYVLPIYETKGDVDYSVGNIDFVGMVMVGGWVRDGFSIKAGGDIEIRGGVEGANIEADGDITIVSGVQGHNKGLIKANGDIKAKYLSAAKVHSKGNIIVNDGVLHSEVFAVGKIIAKGGKGVISGGILRAGENIEAKVIGSHLGTETEIEVGVIPEIRGELTKTEEELEKVRREADEAQKAIVLIENEKEEKGDLAKDRKELLDKLKMTYPILQNEIADLKTKKDELANSVFASKRARVLIASKIYPGVKVNIRDVIMQVKDELNCCSLYEKEGEIKLGPYE